MGVLALAAAADDGGAAGGGGHGAPGVSRQVAQQRVEVAAGAGGVGEFEAFAELVHGQPALADRLVEPADDGVTFGVRRAHARTGTVLFADGCEGSARA